MKNKFIIGIRHTRKHNLHPIDEFIFHDRYYGIESLVVDSL